MFTARLRRVGNSLSILVPKKTLDEMHVKEGDEVEVALMPPARGRQRLFEMAGMFPTLGPFERDRNDKY